MKGGGSGWMSVLAALVMVLAQQAPGSGHAPFTLVESNATGWNYRYTPSALPPRSIVIDGVPHRVYDGPAPEGSGGTPMLPVDVLTLGVPAGTVVAVDLIDASYTDETGVLIAPVPAFTRTEDGNAVPVYTKDPAAYARNGFVPAVTQSIEGPYVLRHARLVSIRLSPMQYNPVTKTLRRLSTGTLIIRRTRKERQPIG